MKDVTTTVHELRELKAMREELDVQIERLESEIKQIMVEQHTEELKGVDWKVTWYSVQSRRIDTKAFKKVLPEVAEQFTITSTCRRFVLK